MISFLLMILGLYCLWSISYAFIRGKILTKYNGWAYRKNSPDEFWAYVCINSALLLVAVVFFGWELFLYHRIFFN